VAPPPRRHGNALIRSGADRGDREPVARDGEAPGQRVRSLDDGDGQHDARGAGRERQANVIGRLQAAGELQRHGHLRRDRADGLEVHGRGPLRTVEVDEVQDPGALGDELLGDPVGAVGRCPGPGRGAGPVDDPGAPRLDVDRRDDVHHLSPRLAARDGGS
jgi:hypothetical protein